MKDAFARHSRQNRRIPGERGGSASKVLLDMGIRFAWEFKSSTIAYRCIFSYIRYGYKNAIYSFVLIHVECTSLKAFLREEYGLRIFNQRATNVHQMPRISFSILQLSPHQRTTFGLWYANKIIQNCRHRIQFKVKPFNAIKMPRYPFFINPSTYEFRGLCNEGLS